MDTMQEGRKESTERIDPMQHEIGRNNGEPKSLAVRNGAKERSMQIAFHFAIFCAR